MDGTESLATIILNRRGVQVAFLTAVLVLVPLALVTARRMAWSLPRVVAAAGAAVGLSLVAGVTLGRRPGIWEPTSLTSCARDASWALDTPEAVLNVALFAPAAFFAVFAVRQVWSVALGVLLLSCGIEATQAILGVGTCQTSDIARNAAGGALAAVAAHGLRWLGRDD